MYSNIQTWVGASVRSGPLKKLSDARSQKIKLSKKFFLESQVNKFVPPGSVRTYVSPRGPDTAGPTDWCDTSEVQINFMQAWVRVPEVSN